ncbi:hypothetical protein SGFS_074410 [Streptomyces graminofaciens]|uniref:Uncharacterized protein n=1 Tax=Streptomyces graminofaciens TaxID=68212 RepID=A0ABM7FGF7_9ACTN|nr:hypothetical protein [Streptomyces graminofaciens]BBC36147.1 hypothetical protein SGFS_074410 [Streptomyces graminofaciens]
MRRQEVADVMDAESLKRRLPDSAVRDLGEWLVGVGARCAAGAGTHAVDYVPAHWSGIEPWPDRLLDRSHAQPVALSRTRVAEAVREATEHAEWSEALVAPYVWGQGRNGYGPHRLKEILAQPSTADALNRAGIALRSEGAVAAYRALHGAVKGLGPAFFTKFLYFLDLATDAPHTPRALILDQRVARVMRDHASRVGTDIGLTSAPAVATWIWSDGGWTPHRYEVYLRWMTAAADQLASAGIGWPRSSPDLLELAVFNGVWKPAGSWSPDGSGVRHGGRVRRRHG